MAPVLTRHCRGIGAEIASLLGRRGANVVVNYVSTGSRQRSEDLAKVIEGYGVKAVAVQADISKVAECPKLIEAALSISQTGKIEILIHKYDSLLGFSSIGGERIQSKKKRLT